MRMPTEPQTCLADAAIGLRAESLKLICFELTLSRFLSRLPDSCVRSHMADDIAPNKFVEGAVGGFVSGEYQSMLWSFDPSNANCLSKIQIRAHDATYETNIRYWSVDMGTHNDIRRH